MPPSFEEWFLQKFGRAPDSSNPSDVALDEAFYAGSDYGVAAAQLEEGEYS